MRSKVFALVLCLSLLTLLFTACGKGKKPEKNREYNEAEVCAAAQQLIEKSKILNEIYWGEGIRYIEAAENDKNPGVYRPADPEYMEWLYQNHGIKDVETLKAKTREVFSAAGSSSVISSRLENTTGDTGIAGYARYYMAKENDALDTDDGLMVYTKAKNFYENTAAVEYVYDGMRVSAVKGEYLTVSLKVKTTGKDGSTNTRDFTVKLIEEESGYRLSGATYALHPQNSN